MLQFTLYIAYKKAAFCSKGTGVRKGFLLLAACYLAFSLLEHPQLPIVPYKTYKHLAAEQVLVGLLKIKEEKVIIITLNSVLLAWSLTAPMQLLPMQHRSLKK